VIMTNSLYKYYLGTFNRFMCLIYSTFREFIIAQILCYMFFFFCGVGLTSRGTAATSGLLYSPRWVIGGMHIGRGNRSTRRKPAPASLCPPQIPLDQTRARTRAAAVGSQRLTAWAMARPLCYMLPCWQICYVSGMISKKIRNMSV
jgi:hypothetical protein